MKFVTMPDLEDLRGMARGSADEPDDSMPVYNDCYPPPGTPEWERWYQNMDTEFSRCIKQVKPEFLEELSRLAPERIAELDAAWAFPREFLVDMVEFAKTAMSSNMIGLAREVF